jgi:hypothetical protein
VRLHVRVLGAEELLGAVDRELLDLVNDLAAAVVALRRVPLRVLIGGNAADGFENARPREVLGRDQLDLSALPLELASEQLGDLRIQLCEPRALQLLEGLRGNGYGAVLSMSSDATRGRLCANTSSRSRPGAPRAV